MAGPREKMLCLLLTLLVAVVVGCSDENMIVEDSEGLLVASTAGIKLPSWLLIAHRSETLPDEDLGFVVIESEYEVNLEEDQDENDELEAETEEKNSASSSTVKASSSGSASGSSDDKWESSVTVPQQSSNSGTWWEQPFSNDGKSGQILHNVRYNLED